MASRCFSPVLPFAAVLLAAGSAAAQAPAPTPGVTGTVEAPPAAAAVAPVAPATPPAAVVIAGPAPVVVVTPVTPTPPPTPPMVVPAVQLSVPWSGPTGQGVSFGIEEGGWSGVWGNGVRVHIPFVQYFGLTLRGLVFTGANPSTAAAPADHAGGRFDLVGRSPVFLNLVRLYGGGGVEVFSAFGSGVDHTARVSGGGHFGFEFFLNRRFSFYLEVGGHGGVDNGLPGGETVVAGMNLYPFT